MKIYDNPFVKDRDKLFFYGLVASEKTPEEIRGWTFDYERMRYVLNDVFDALAVAESQKKREKTLEIDERRKNVN